MYVCFSSLLHEIRYFKMKNFRKFKKFIVITQIEAAKSLERLILGA